ncbi:hypothetical protein Lsed01_00868 [Demequina sediminis]|uniref:Site-specific integrase n=2 Tax=Demequina sediminis TaxID=1930058 RepID=A0ABP9WH50_9MICO
MVRRFGGDSAIAKRVVRDTSPTGSMLVMDYARRHINLKYAAGKLSDGTLRNYESALSKYWGTIGALRLDQLSSENVTQFITSLNVIDADNKASAYNTQHGHFRFLSTVLNAASRAGLIDSRVITTVEFPTEEAWGRTATQRRNPAPIRRHARTNRADRVIPKTQFLRLSAALAKQLVNECSPLVHAEGWCAPEAYLAVVTGMRQGERLAIRRRNIAFEHDDKGKIRGALLSLDSHALPAEWFHGCGDISASGKFPCGEVTAKACPQTANNKQGSSMMRLAPGTKSKKPGSVHYLPLTVAPAIVLRHHLRYMERVEGLSGRDDLVFGGAINARKPARHRADTEESYAKRLDAWEEARHNVKRDGVTIRTPERDRAAWQALQEAFFYESEEKGFSVHDIRHSVLTRLALDTNLNAMQLMALANHSNISTTMRYVELRGSDAAREALSATAGMGQEYAESIGVDFMKEVMRVSLRALDGTPNPRKRSA